MRVKIPHFGRHVSSMSAISLIRAKLALPYFVRLLALNFHAVLVSVREGAEVIIEQDHLLVAVIRTPQGSGRTLDKAIATAEAYEARLCEDFAKDALEAINARREPLEPPAWDLSSIRASSSLQSDERTQSGAMHGAPHLRPLSPVHIFASNPQCPEPPLLVLVPEFRNRFSVSSLP